MDFWDSAFRMFSALAVVLGLMMLAVAIVRRVMGARALSPSQTPLVQVLSTGYLGPRKTISIVSVAGEWLIVGATATDLIPLGRVRNRKGAEHVSADLHAPVVESGGWMP